VDKPLVILHGEIKTPPFSSEARRWAGFLLRRLQQGHVLTMPDSRPMPAVGVRCHELRVRDVERRMAWRVLYRVDSDAVLIAEVFATKTRTTPPEAIAIAQARLRKYDEDRRYR